MKWIRILLIIFILVVVIRYFFIESYRMPSTQMENAILKGDFILVDKTVYGIRTPASFPDFDFIPDTIIAFTKKYPAFFNLNPYIWNSRPVKRNDIVVYHIPDSSDYPVNRKSVSISRCIGLPGDSIEVINTDYFINGEKIAQSPDLMLSYCYDSLNCKKVYNMIKQLKIPLRESHTGGILLSRYELYLINEQSEASGLLIKDSIQNFSYKLYIPEKHYWFLSDNMNESADSRHYGFIPHSHLIGKARMIWMSKEYSGNLLTGYRKNRIFSIIN